MPTNTAADSGLIQIVVVRHSIRTSQVGPMGQPSTAPGFLWSAAGGWMLRRDDPDGDER